MSVKRTYSTALSPGDSTAGTPTHLQSPASLSPVASTSALSLAPAPKRRKVGRPRKTRESAGSAAAFEAGKSATESHAKPGAVATQAEEEDDDDDEEDEYLKKGKLGDDDYTIRKREDQANKEKLRVLLEHFDKQQSERYSEYRSSGLNKTNVRRLANAVLQQSVSERIVIATRGFAKVFVGDIVERALEIQKRRGGSGPLTTYDVKQAYRAHLLDKDRGGSDRRAMFIR